MNGIWTSFVALLAQAAPPAKADEVPWQLFAIGAAVFILPFVLGTLLGRALKLKDLSFKFGLVLFAIFFSLSPFVYYQAMSPKGWMGAIKLGIDLAGGTNLVYQVDTRQAQAEGKQVDVATLDKMVEAVKKRINPSGAEEVTVRRVGADRLEIIIPGADKDVVQQKKNAITKLGSLEFAILANERRHASIIQQAKQLSDKQDELRKDGRVVASWREVDPKEESRMSTEGQVAVREVTRRNQDREEVPVRQFLVTHEAPDDAVTGRFLLRAGSNMDPERGLAVSFTLNTRGGIRFAKLTSKYQPEASDGFRHRLAILLDGKIHSAPDINERIPSGSVQITGSFTQKDVDALIAVLNAGALEVPLIPEPVFEFTISPTLGIDVQRDGIRATLISAVAVFILMLIYYRVGGVIADLCLALNLLLVIGSMAFIDATFTLPGIAGLVLTIGMAIDSNVLINERMKEELARGASMRMAIENGFNKALSAIVDGNVTALITALILYLIGSDQVRGFAVTLFLGLVMSLFSVLVFGHMCFNVIERKRWVTKLNMFQIIGKTNIDFLGQRKWAFLFSGVMVTCGVVALVMRGPDNLDIDFSGGTMVTFEFVEPQETDAVQEKLTEKFGPSLGLERLVLSGETATAGTGRRFRVRTTEQNQEVVAKQISEAFDGAKMQLVRVTLTYSEPQAIAQDSKDLLDERFAGGHRSELKFSSGLGTATITDFLGRELRAINGPDGASKYVSTDSLIAVVGRTPEESPADPNVSTEKFVAAEALVAPEVAEADFAEALRQLQSKMAASPVFEEVNSFASQVAGETMRNALLALLISFVAIVIYIWFRFENIYYGLAALLALGHDVLITAGSIAIAAYLSRTPIGPLLLLDDFRFNLTIVASLLAIVGYALNDTVVIFDRLREIRGKNPHITYEMINMGVNETLSRSIMTALTTLIVVVILYVFGGEGIHGFAYANIIGTVISCYSTVYIANPVLLWLVTRPRQTPGPATSASARPVPA